MNKKLFLIFSISIFFIELINAQDTIIKMNGDTVLAKISEITPIEIKYKRFNFQDGPVYTEEKSTISIIKFSNGLKESFKQESATIKEKTITNDYYSGTPINNKIEAWGSRYRYQNSYRTEKDIQDVLLATKDRKIIGLVGQAKDAKNLQYIGFAGIPLGITAIGFFWKSTGIFNYTNYNYTNGRVFNQRDLAISALCSVAAIACPVISIVAKGNRTKYNRQAVKIYNEKF